MFFNISQLMNGGEPVSVIVIINSVYKFFIHSLFCGVESRNYFTMRIIAYSCLALLILTHIAFIRKQNKFTIKMFYFWNNIIFGLPNAYIFAIIVFLATNTR